MNLLSIHLPAKPSAEDCATALRLIFIVAGPDIFQSACDQLPDIDSPRAPAAPNLETALEAAGFGADDDGEEDGPAAPAVPGAAPTVDAKGIPWDERIHSSTKGQNQDGSWKKRRGVQEEMYNRITAELSANVGDIPAFLDRRGQASVAPAAPVPPAPPAPPAPPTPAAPVPPAPAAPGGAAPTNFAEFMRAAGAYLPGNRITMGEINEICTQLGYASPMEMKAAADGGASLFPIAFEMVKDKAASKGGK